MYVYLHIAMHHGRDRDIRARESSEQREARLSERRLAYRERAKARRGSETLSAEAR